MTESLVRQPLHEPAITEIDRTRWLALAHPVSWGAIAAGSLVAILTGIMLNALGAGTLAGMVDAVARDTPDGTTFARTSAIWFGAATLLGVFAGGWVAGRLLDRPDSVKAMLHGAAVWAVAWAVAISLLGSAASGGVVAALRGAGATAAGVARSAADAAGSVSPDALVERIRGTLTAPADPATAPREELVAEAGRIVLARLRGDWTPAQRERLSAIVAQLAGIPPQEASARIDAAERDMQQAVREAEETARRAADAAATATATAALFGFGAMLATLLAALLGGYLAARRSGRRTDESVY